LNIKQKGVTNEWWFISLEGVITLLMIIEIIIRIFVLGIDYFRNCFNIIDFIIVFFCFLSFLLFLLSIHRSFGKELEEILETVLIIFRSLIQTIRIIFFIYQTKKNNEFRNLNNNFEIELDNINKDLENKNDDFKNNEFFNDNEFETSNLINKDEFEKENLILDEIVINNGNLNEITNKNDKENES
jgi:hypothetical protein